MKSLPLCGHRIIAPAAILLALSTGCSHHAPPVSEAQNQQQNGPGSPFQSQSAQPNANYGNGNFSPFQPNGQGEGYAPNQAPPRPASIAIPPGARLVVRMGESITVKHAYSGEAFYGDLVEPVVVGNTVAIPAHSPVEGRVVFARRRGRFAGRSVLELTLTRMRIYGADYRIDTSDLTETKRGKGRRTAALIGGGAGLGMLVGGIASGGVGLLVGGLAGGGAGTAASAFTGNSDITIPAEAVVTFRLEEPLRLANYTQQTASVQ